MKIDLVKLVEEVYKLEGEPKNVNKVFALICLQAFKEQLTFSCTELRDKETPKIEDWLKDHKFEQSNNGFHKNGIEYKVNEITWMYIQDVYNL